MFSSRLATLTPRVGSVVRMAAPVKSTRLVLTERQLTAALLHSVPVRGAHSGRVARWSRPLSARTAVMARMPNSRVGAVRAMCTEAPTPKEEPKVKGNVPLKTRTSAQQDQQGITVGQWAIGFVILGFVAVGGYNIVRLLMPTKMSTNSMFNRAADIIRQNPEIASRMGGEVKCYGKDFNSRREGRRFMVEDYRYEKNNIQYLRIKFTVEGPGGAKADAFAEVRSDQKDHFHYLMVRLRLSGEVITIHDNRSPEKPVAVRRADTAMALQSVRATLYGKDSEEDTRRQKVVLGEHMNLIRYIQCDENPFECQSAGVTETPSWMIDNKLYPGFQELEDLEKIAESVKGKTMVVA